ncbi:MAG: aminotransferase class III-fold pyridoxal phosphate-dependent enzyme, partial [Clostridiales bacterium]|nr:aminotransferase class III-fold pyridoxal phosphate-dependent enzyme [Clostridiales bacterium]
GIVPDMVTISKSIGGYGVPLALTLFKPELDIWAPGEHNGTFRGNQIAFVAARAALELMLKDNLEAEVRRKGEIVKTFLKDEIATLDSRIEVRGVGLLWGIDMVKIPNISKKVIAQCFKRGLIIERAGRNNDVIKVMPPLIISDENLRKGLNIIKESIIAVLNEN